MHSTDRRGQTEPLAVSAGCLILMAVLIGACSPMTPPTATATRDFPDFSLPPTLASEAVHIDLVIEATTKTGYGVRVDGGAHHFYGLLPENRVTFKAAESIELWVTDGSAILYSINDAPFIPLGRAAAPVRVRWQWESDRVLRTEVQEPRERKSPATPSTATTPEAASQVEWEATLMDFMVELILEQMYIGIEAETIEQLFFTLPDVDPNEDTIRVWSTDITDDGSPEFVLDLDFRMSSYLYVIGRHHGTPSIFYRQVSSSVSYIDAQVHALRDLNRNGLPELVHSQTVRSAHPPFPVHVYVKEWSGEGFADLLLDVHNSKSYPHSYVSHGFDRVEDMDQDGDLELVLLQSGGPRLPRTGVPVHGEVVWEWNGNFYRRGDRPFPEPTYRFQAARFGDQATLDGDFEVALTYYQETVFDQDLLALDRANERLLPDFATPPPSFVEFAHLRAYARYRIMLLHLARGFRSGAQTVYETLQSQFSRGPEGHLYALLAQQVWDAYLEGGNIDNACRSALPFIAENLQTIQNQIGYGRYGESAPGVVYSPEHLCPFGTTSELTAPYGTPTPAPTWIPISPDRLDPSDPIPPTEGPGIED